MTSNNDIRKTGPQTYRELQEENEKNYISDTDFLNYIGELQKKYQPTSQYDPYANAPQDLKSPLFNTNTPWGESFFDDKVTDETGFSQLGDLRAENQPWYSKIGNGVAKGAILAGTTFANGTAGLVVGATSAIVEKDFSAFWDNPFSRAMQSVNEWSEEFAPNYYTEAEQTTPWYENIFTANFLGDKFIKNLGFTVGAMYSGKVFNVAIGSKIGQLAGLVTKSAKVPSMVSSVTGAAISALNEGSIEALNNSNDWIKMQTQQAQDNYDDVLILLGQEYNRNKGQGFVTIDGQIYDPAYLDYMNKAEEAKKTYEETLAKINEDKAKMGNADLLMNIPLLMASNMLQFAKFYSRGFKTSRMANNIVRNADNTYSTTMSMKKGVAKGIANGLYEGVEEMGQFAASTVAGNYYATDVNNFYKAKIDPNAEQETLSWIKSFASGINETLNNGSAWEEGFIGALTGFLGVPGFRSARGANGKFRSPITIEGGLFGEVRDYREELQKENDIVNKLNARVKSPDFMNYYRGLIRHNKYQNDMNNAAVNNDEFEFKNAEHAQLVSDIELFDNAGRLDDLKAIINTSYDTSDENLQSIVENTTSIEKDASGKEIKVGPFIDKNGNPMYSTPEGKKEMIDKLTKAKDTMLNTMQEYVNLKHDIDVRSKQALSDEQLEELVWLKSQIKNWQGRSETLGKEVAGTLTKLMEQYNSDLVRIQQEKQREGADRAEITEEYKRLEQEEETLKNNIEILKRLTTPGARIGAELLYNPDMVKDLKEIIADEDYGFTQDEVDDYNRKVDDILKLEKGSRLYRQKFKEYILNPARIDEANAKAEENITSEEKKKQNAELKDQLSKARNMSEFRNTFGNYDKEGVDKNSVIDEMVNEGYEMAKNFKEMSKYHDRVVRAIQLKNELTDQQRNDAIELFNSVYNQSTALNDIAEPRSIAYDEESNLPSAAGDIDRFHNAQSILQQVIEDINQSDEFKNALSSIATPAPAPKSTPEPGAPTSSTTGSSGTPTITPVNAGGKVTITPSVPTPTIVATISEQEMKEENEKLAKQFDKNEPAKKSTKKLYYHPIVTELDNNSIKYKNDFRPLNEINPNFEWIYSYLKDKGAFDYVNKGELKEGDKLYFYISHEFELGKDIHGFDTKTYPGPTIFLVKQVGTTIQIVGSLPQGKNIVNYAGLQQVIERMTDLYNKDGVVPVSKESVTVSQIMDGTIVYSDKESDLTNERIGGADVKFGIIKNGTFVIPNTPSGLNYRQPSDISNKEGRVYMLIKSASGVYIPTAVRVKHFTEEEYSKNEYPNTPIREKILNAIQNIVKAGSETKSEADINAAVGDLKRLLYVPGNVHINAIKEGTDIKGISFVVADTDEKGNEIYNIVDGKRIRKEKQYNIWFDSDETVLVGTLADDGQVVSAPTTENEAKNKSTNPVGELLKLIQQLDFSFQVNREELNTKKGNDFLLDSGVLTSNVSDVQVKNCWFTTTALDEDGKELSPEKLTSQTKVVEYEKPKPETKLDDKTITGFEITRNGTTYIVNIEKEEIYDKNGRKVSLNKVTQQLWVDAARVQNTYGNAINGINMIDGKVLLPDGNTFDRKTGNRLNKSEAQKLKNDLEKAKEGKETADKVLEKIRANQELVDKDRTDNEAYYIKEEDGEYHPYKRVHSVIGDNWKDKESTLNHIQIELQKALEKGKENYNNYLTNLENKYNVGLAKFKYADSMTDEEISKRAVQDRADIIDHLSKNMMTDNGRLAVEAGSMTDSVVRQFFNTNGEDVYKPEGMSQEAFDSIMKSLQGIKDNMNARGETFYANNIVIFYKDSEGNRVAGELDILSVGATGNFRIYDIKTSKYSFYPFTSRDRFGHEFENNYFENPASYQRMSSKDYYTLQLSAYKNIFESQYGIPITRLGILPFVLTYDKDGTITGIKKEKGIGLTYNPAVPVVNTFNNRQVSSTSSTSSTPKTTPVSNTGIVIDETNVVNHIGDEAYSFPKEFEKDCREGYFTLPVSPLAKDEKAYTQGKEIHKGQIYNLGDIGNFHNLGLVRILKRGGMNGEKGFVNAEYYIVLPNGATKIVANQSITVDINAIINAVKESYKNADKQSILKQLSNIDTSIAQEQVEEQQSTQVSAAAHALQVQQALQQESDSEYEDDDLTPPIDRKVDSVEREAWNPTKELNWAKRVLPQLSEEDRIHVVKGLIKAATKGAKAWGQFKRGMITISDMAAVGTVYHEAFHYVFHSLLDNNERQALFREAKQKYGNRTYMELEDMMAEDFREYVMRRNTKNIFKRIGNFFEDLFIKVRNWNRIQPHLTGYYQMINNGIYARSQSSISREELLRKETQTFLNNFGITIRDVSEYDEDVPLFDALNRVINVSNANDITEGVGYAMAFMMQHNKYINDLMRLHYRGASKSRIKLSKASINERGNFGFDSNFMTRKAKEEFGHDEMLHQIGRDIAVELRHLYGIEKPTDINNAYTQAIWNVIDHFYSKLTPRFKTSLAVARNTTIHLANAVKLNDYSIIQANLNKPGTTTPASRVNIEQALLENPYENSIIRTLGKYDIALAGSASIAINGVLLRPSENPLHDIDFSAKGKTKEDLDAIMEKEYPNYHHIRTIDSKDGTGNLTETYLILSRPYIIEADPNNKKVFILKDAKTKEVLGSYFNSELTLNENIEGLQGKFLDFFTGKNSSPYGSNVRMLNGQEYLISDFRNALSAKIDWARLKDIWDYNRFIPIEQIESLEEYREQQEERVKEKVQNARIVWGHPALGKTTYLDKNSDILEWDDLVNDKRTKFIRNIIDPNHLLSEEEYKTKQSEYMADWKNHPEYIEFLTREWDNLVARAKRENKRLFASPIALLEIGAKDIDLVVALNNRDFVGRNMQRGGSEINSKNWKQNIDKQLVMIDPEKVVYTDKYFSEFMRDNLGVQWGTLTTEEMNQLKSRGWTEEEFNLISQEERDLALKCIAF